MNIIKEESGAEYQTLSRLAIYLVLLAWLLLSIYILSITSGNLFGSGMFRYFLSLDQSGIKFRALMLLGPLLLSVMGYLINQSAKLSKKNSLAEKELRTLLNDIISALANALDAKSPWTKGHSERVTSYALSIAGELNLSAADLDMLKIAGLLHDIGKIGTFDGILDKAGPLTEEEWKLVKLHPVKGEEILKPIKQLEYVIQVLKHHHESFDGTGYPDGLKGGEIPLLARILCLADSFDAMTAARPYKAALSKEAAVFQLQRKAGRQFDPDLVQVFIGILKIDVPAQEPALVDYVACKSEGF